MKECLVDVLNARDTVLHVFPIVVENQDGTSNAVDAEQEALRLAASMQLVPEAETEGLRARPHVSRSRQLTPCNDPADAVRKVVERNAHCTQVRAYFLWQHEGCSENRSEEHWRRARELESLDGPA